VHANTHTREPPQPHPVPVLALEGAVSPLGIGCGRFAGARVRTGRFGAQESDGCSQRIGSVLNDSAVRAVARCGTRRFATLHSACHSATTFLEPRGESTGICERLGVKFPGPTRQFRTHAAQQILVHALQQYAHATRAEAERHLEQRETPKLNDGGVTEIVLLRTRHPQFLARRCGQPDCRSIQGSSPVRPFRLQ
jgi:hypothetical protein